MNDMTRTLTFLAGVLFLATPTLAQSTTTIGRIIDSRFAASDTNKDGRLTKAEAEAGGMDRVVANFTTLDTQKRGYVTVAQIKAMAARR